MRLTKLTIVACAALLLATVPLAAAQAGQPGQITPENAWTQTVDDNTVTITYVVNTSGNQALANSVVTIKNHSNELELASNRTQQLKGIRGGEQKRVSYGIRIPKDTEQGNYTVTANLSRNGQTLDSANYTVWVNYDNMQSDSSDSSSSESEGNSAEESGTDSEGEGGGGAIMAVRDCGLTCLDDNLWAYVKSLLPEWLSEFL